jgi:hypothetical protein
LNTKSQPQSESENSKVESVNSNSTSSEQESETESSSSSSSNDSLIKKIRYQEIKASKSDVTEYESEEDDNQTVINQPIPQYVPPPSPYIQPQPSPPNPTPIILEQKPVLSNQQDKLSIEDQEYQKKKDLIISIRKYCEAFWDGKLEHVIRKNKHDFYATLSDMSVKKLQITLDNIKYEISLRKLNINAESLVKTGAIGVEKLISYTGYNIDGTVDELWADDDFRDDLKLLLCEMDVEKIINPKTAILLRVARTAYMRNQLNKVNKNVEQVVNKEVPSDFLDRYKKI